MKTEEEAKKKLTEVRKDIERAINDWEMIHLKHEEAILEWILEEDKKKRWNE